MDEEDGVPPGGASELAALSAELRAQRYMLEWFFYALLHREADVLETYLDIAACLLGHLEEEGEESPRTLARVADFAAVLQARWETNRAAARGETRAAPAPPALAVIEGGKAGQ